jgi:hypothetical protein
MATAIFGPRGITVARNLLKAQGQGLDLIQGGGLMQFDEHTLVWENHGFGLKTTNSMVTNNAMIFQYPANSTIRHINLCDSVTKARALTLVLQTGTIQNDTIKFLREIVITLDEPA